MNSTTDTRSPHLWRNANYVKILAANFMLYFSFMLLTPLLPLYLKDTFGADKDMIGFVLSGYTLMCLIVRPFSGYIVTVFPARQYCSSATSSSSSSLQVTSWQEASPPSPSSAHSTEDPSEQRR